MTNPSTASAVRPGEHACARLGRAEDHQVLSVAFIRHGLDAGHRVVCLGEHGDGAPMVDALRAADRRGDEALASGQLMLCDADKPDVTDGTFAADRVIGLIREAHAAALRDGYAALSITGDMGWVLADPPSPDALVLYEQRLNDEARDTLLMLCRYDQGLVALSSAGDIAAQHSIDIGPELVALTRTGNLAGAWTGRGDGAELRLAGELDYTGAEALTRVLAANLHGRVEVDLSDVEFIDVAGMRALRGRNGQRLRITAASPVVRRLVALLAWDTDPAVELL